ncbi:MAG: hypothetical protein ACOC6P_00305 [Candidatus Aminicenantaceae bacterium]
MATKIERMNRIRKNIIRGIFLATTIAFVWFMSPNIAKGWVESSFQSSSRSLERAGVFWIISLLVFGVMSRWYKIKLRDDQSLYDAVNDDRIKLGWLKAYRFAFIVAFLASIFWQCYHYLWTRWRFSEYSLHQLERSEYLSLLEQLKFI